MQVLVQIPFEIRRASKEECEAFGQPFGAIELLDSDGLRLVWAHDVQTALDHLHDIVQQSGYSEFTFNHNGVTLKGS